MRHSSFIILTASLALLSGMTWAGPPDQESSDPPASESMQIEIEVPAEDASEETAEPIKVLSFEEALAACNDAIDLQSCVDEKTQQLPDKMEPETEPDVQDMPTNAINMDTQDPACDPELEDGCPDIE